MENIERRYDPAYLRSPKVWSDMHAECKLLLKDQPIEIDWRNRLLITSLLGLPTLGTGLLLLLLWEGVQRKFKMYPTFWQETAERRLRQIVNLDGQPTSVRLYAFGDIPIERCRSLEIHVGRWADDYVRFIDGKPSHHGYDLYRRSSLEEMAEKYKKAVDILLVAKNPNKR